MDTRVSEVTVRPVEPLMEPDVALMVVLPVAIAVASPPPLMVATEVALDGQVTELVRPACCRHCRYRWR